MIDHYHVSRADGRVDAYFVREYAVEVAQRDFSDWEKVWAAIEPCELDTSVCPVFQNWRTRLRDDAYKYPHERTEE